MNLQGRDLTLDLTGDDVRLLQSELAQIGLAVPDDERQRAVFGRGTYDAVAHFQEEHQLTPTGLVDAGTARAINRAVNDGTYTVEGAVVSPDRAGVGGLRVQIVDRNVGQDDPLGETVSDQRGHYQLSFATPSLHERQKNQPDLQARVYTGETFLAASDVRYNAANAETLNVTLPANSVALPSEYETLTGMLAAHYSGPLGDLKETDDQQDITYLGNKTGWDARAVALAALADQFSRDPAVAAVAAAVAGRPDAAFSPVTPVAVPSATVTVPASPTVSIPSPTTTSTAPSAAAAGIQPAYYYALFRAGLPANADTLYQADAQTVGLIWKQAIDQGVIPSALASDIPRALEVFHSVSATHALNSPSPVGTSSLKDMLSLTLGDDAQRQQQFADLYTRYRGDLPTFWDAVTRTFGEATTQRLRLDGQLGYLTLSNAPLINRLYDAEKQAPLSSSLDLAQRGYYHAEKWVPLLDATIPAPVPGATPDEKRANYAEVLAAQVRLSFPTAVVADMVGSGEIPLNTAADVQDGVHSFLSEHQDNFEIGMQPIEQYVARNNLGETITAPVKEQIKRLQRVYQITPNDQAMKALLENNLDSAYQVVRYDQAEFVSSFQDAMGGEEAALLTYAKSHQVHNAVLNIAGSYLTARRAAALGSDANTPIIDPAPTAQAPWAMEAPASKPGLYDMQPKLMNAPEVVDSAALERLFGSMDYCSCSACRSILSPAAYLVDLLLFLDHPVNDPKNPQAVLLKRRPDIQHLPLTCENTNTPIPYIDLVNETLEYFVANNFTLADYPGHNTDDSATPEELLASPRFVKDAAYEVLKKELFPTPLPFHQPLEALRRYFDTFGVLLEAAMEVLRSDDAVERANAGTYGWRDILMEELKLSRAEYNLLTDRTLTLQQLYGYPLATSDAEVLADLANVKAFTRRTGVTYDDVIKLLETKFINPDSALIRLLERLGISFSTLKATKDSAKSDDDFMTQLKALLPPGLDSAEYGGDIPAWVNRNYDRIMGLIVIANPTNSTDLCSFEKLEFRYANPVNNANSLHTIEYVRLARFIRLWKKLGWTIDQTDTAMSALYPAEDLPAGVDDVANLHRLDSGFLALLPRLGIAHQVMDRLNLQPERDLLGLLACWSPLDIHGGDSLYQKMFLSPALLKKDVAFADDGDGNVLQDKNQTLTAHTEALRAAFNLTGDELSLVVVALVSEANNSNSPPKPPWTPDTVPLTLDTISAVYRRAWLARTLRLSVRELLLLTQFTDLDPFTAPDPPNPPVIRLLKLITALRDTSLKPAQALYLIWNQDVNGKSAPDDRQITDLARTLRAGFADIESAFALADDPNGDIARAHMALVYGSDATDFFFGLLDNTLSVDVPYSHSQSTLEQPILDAAAGRISYDDFRSRLSYSGVLSTTTRDALKAVNGVSPQFQAAVDGLYAANQTAIGPFFARYPELMPLYSGYVASTDPPQTKRTTLLANFLPDLKKRRKIQQALAVVSGAARTDGAFAQTVLGDATVLHAAADKSQPAIDDLTAMEIPGLSAQFFWRDTATGTVDSTADAVAMLDYSAAGATKLPENPAQGNPISGIWSGYLEIPENGLYHIAVETDAGASVTMTLDSKDAKLAPTGTMWRNPDPIALIAGTLHPVVLKVEKVTNGLSARWQTTGGAWEIIPPRYLYPATFTDHLRGAYLRFLKLSSLATDLKLTADETAHFAAHTDYQIGGQGWLNALPVLESPDVPTSRSLRDVLAALLDFARIKAALSPDDERLLSVLQDPAAILPNGDRLLLTVTRWESGSLDVLLKRFGVTQLDLAHLDTFRRVYDAYAQVAALGIPASALLAATTNEPTVDALHNVDTVRDLQSALRARYDQEADWLQVLKPINDTLRALQRDALVACVLQHLGEDSKTSAIDTPDKLLEYFLMDVQMEPCMQTSRIRHALSSVQLFVERCLMNLEPDLAPASIDPAKWAWMKRYRVWEANRKVFLWPENWLEPELRDDQSPIFRETMSELLQSDITEDTAATALLNYLSRLEEVAKLEPCGIHYVENSPGKQGSIVHVVARTTGAQHKYYYRRSDHPSWTPWEQIKLDIEDNPVIPVVWKDRLLLFWLRILKQSPGAPPSSKADTKTLHDITPDDVKQGTQVTMTVQAVLCWSEYYNGKWQPTKTSDVDRPTTLGQQFEPGPPDPNHPMRFDRSQLRLRVSEEGDALRVRVRIFADDRLSSFLLYNTHSLPAPEEDVPDPDPDTFITPTSRWRFLTRAKEMLRIIYPPGPSFSNQLKCDVLTDLIPFTTVQPQHPLQDTWDAPFFFQDSRHLFYVSTSESITTVGEFSGHGMSASPAQQGIDIPPLVLKQDPNVIPLQDEQGLRISGSDHGFVDPSPLARFVSEDRNIRTAIGTTGSVSFGNREIGPAGELADGHLSQP